MIYIVEVVSVSLFESSTPKSTVLEILILNPGFPSLLMIWGIWDVKSLCPVHLPFFLKMGFLRVGWMLGPVFILCSFCAQFVYVF